MTPFPLQYGNRFPSGYAAEALFFYRSLIATASMGCAPVSGIRGLPLPLQESAQ